MWDSNWAESTSPLSSESLGPIYKNWGGPFVSESKGVYPHSDGKLAMAFDE